jgi:hypothetical protein
MDSALLHLLTFSLVPCRLTRRPNWSWTLPLELTRGKASLQVLMMMDYSGILYEPSYDRPRLTSVATTESLLTQGFSTQLLASSLRAPV